jgi:hypothetical protein
LTDFQGLQEVSERLNHLVLMPIARPPD